MVLPMLSTALPSSMLQLMLPSPRVITLGSANLFKEITKVRIFIFFFNARTHIQVYVHAGCVSIFLFSYRHSTRTCTLTTYRNKRESKRTQRNTIM